MSEVTDLVSKLKDLKRAPNPVDALREKLQLSDVVIKRHVRIDQFDAFTRGVPILPRADGSNSISRNCPHLKVTNKRTSPRYYCRLLSHVNEFVYGITYKVGDVTYTTKHASLLGCNGCVEKLKFTLAKQKA